MFSKTLKRTICILVLAVFMASFILTGCNSGDKTEKTTTEAKKETTTQAKTEEVKKELKGTINISMVLGPQKVIWEDIGKAYSQINPGVKVVVEDKDNATYADWLAAQIASGKVTADIVTNNVVANYISENKFVDFSNYLNQSNPYAEGQIWKDTMNALAYPPIGPNHEIFQLNLESVQLPWFYNKNIFEKVGVQPPKDWDELVEVCKKIKEAGYTAIALPGDAMSFWAGTMGWLVMRYQDQYWKDKEELIAAKEGDYIYDPEVDGKWEFDINDKFNDDTPSKVNFNLLRVAKLNKHQAEVFMYMVLRCLKNGKQF